MRSMLKSAILLVIVLQLSISGFTQQTKPAPPAASPRIDEQQKTPAADEDVVRITTNLVQVDPVITDGNGKPVTDLRPDEVQILEDGKPQSITNFSYIALDAPVARNLVKPDKNAAPAPPVRLRPEQVRRTIALVVDDLGLSFESAHYVRQALKNFLDKQMQPNDLVAIIRTGGGVGALQQFTSDKRQLYAAVEKVKWNPLGRGGISAFAPIRSQSFSMASSGASESVTEANDELDQFRADLFSVGTLGAVNYIVSGLRNLPGRKSIVLMSEGFKMVSTSHPEGNVRILAALHTLTDMANRASVVVYTLDPRGLPALGYDAADDTSGMTPTQIEQSLSDRRSDFFESQNGLSYLAQQTGGLSIRNTNDLTGGLRKVLEDQGGYYLIGYRPDESTFDSVSGKRKFHKLSIKVLRPGKFHVRVRNGFYGITDEEAKPPQQAGMNRLISALTSPFGTADIHVRLTSLFAYDAKMGAIMRSMLHVDARDLTFKDEADGWHTASFDILAYTFGDNGAVIDHMGRKHTMRVKGKTYERILNNGFTYQITVPVKKPGGYQLRTALRDSSSQRIGSASQYIEVPDIKKNRLTLSGLLVSGISPEVYKKGEAGPATPKDNSDDTTSEPDPRANPAVRQFRSGLVMVYGYYIYNARFDKSTNQPHLLTRVRLFRDGQELFNGKDTPFEMTNQPDPKRLAATGAIQLGAQMLPGEYVLQVIVTDLQASDKQRIATQWIDFDIVK